ncbi:MAG: hypothetical protein H6730_26435 [Deltaproteobacteria bacterium]|nr:hypothetical protein [Deltaproteobacteria bacterium]
MSEDTLADLLSTLPDALRDRADALTRLAEGTLPEAERAALEAEAAEDEDLAFAVSLFTPFDAGELAGVQARVQDALPTAAVVHVLPEAPRAANDEPSTSGKTVLGAFAGMLAVAAVIIVYAISIPKASFQVQGGAELVTTAPGDAARFDLKWLRDGEAPAEATVLAMSGSEVRRVQVPLRSEGGHLVVDVPARTLTGGLAGPVELLFLASTSEDRPLEPVEVRNMIDKFGDLSAARLLVTPPAYALLVQAEGTLRGGHSELDPATTASTAVFRGGQVTLAMTPSVTVAGDLAAHAFVVRGAGAPEALQATFQTRNAAFRTRLSTDEVLGSADEATVYLVVGPAGTPITAHQAVDALPPGFQRVVQRLYVAAQ